MQVCNSKMERVHVLTGAGAGAARAVVKIVLKPGSSATGFLVAPNLIMTSNHVIPCEAAARRATIILNYQYDRDGQLEPLERLAVGCLIYTSPRQDLDYTLLRIRGQPKERSCLRLRRTVPYTVGAKAIVIQHPLGGPKMVARRFNAVTRVGRSFIAYTTHTERDASGSPVLDSRWRLLGLHRGRGQLKHGIWMDNAGVRIDRIAADLTEANRRGRLDADVVMGLGL